MKYFILVCLPVLLIYNFSLAQHLTSDEAVRRALERSPLKKSADLQVLQQINERKASFNPGDPELLIESPTGEFMTVGIEQSISFPSVYIKQGRLAKEKVLLAESNRMLTEQEVMHKVRSAYLNVRYNTALLKLLRKQDSVYASLATASERQFNAGQIDYVARTFSSTQYGAVHTSLMLNEGKWHSSLFELMLYTGLTDSVITDSLTPMEFMLRDTSLASDAPAIQYQKQAVTVAGRSLELERNKVWPSFVFGYLNPGGSDVEIPMRLRAGISIPLWFWKYSSAIKSAKLHVEMVNQNMAAEKQDLMIQLSAQQNDLVNYQAALNYYTAEGFKDTEELASSAGRMFEAGQTDYLTYLRTLNEAYTLQIRQLETIKNLNQTIINIKYLIGE